MMNRKFKSAMNKVGLFFRNPKLFIQIRNRKKKGEYPATVAEVIDDNFIYKKGVIDAIRQYKKTNPWKGTDFERACKLAKLNSALSEIYGIKPPVIALYGPIDYYVKGVIVLRENKFSVLTYLHEFGHALGKNEWDATQWSLNLFKRVFPKKFKKFDQKGHMLVKPEGDIIGFGK